jgi:Ca2+-binding EF-hand superfamily protein
MTRFLTFTAAALLSSFAIAQDQTPPPGETAPPPATAPEQPQSGSIFDSLDANKDGNIAQAEAQAHPTVAEHFTEADANSDGALSPEEFSAAFRTQ